ncbi:FAD-dependent monooxygenase [Micromonospora sp. RTGN7]|uniref:FAD-dependent monooxygenase n=1 Tax=Micromonospora sp. RTGN7 TaxID=3016526 RepID=UPI0029FEE2D1|nr:FAD-dependent monooxygenase [Micromonospora sp. RTGN7]
MLPGATDVLVVGAGPVGLATAVTLARRGVGVTLVDGAQRSPLTSRAAVVHAYTLEVLDRIDAAAPLVARGVRAARFTVRDRDRMLLSARFDALPTRFPYALMVPQSVTETVLADRLAALGGEARRPYRLTGLTREDAGATATFADGATVRARYVVGADGMHSDVRRLVGIGFSGPDDGAESFTLADVRVDGSLPRDEVVLFFAREGLLVWAPLPDGSVRIVAAVADAPEHPDAAYLQRLLDTRGPAGDPGRVTEVLWGSRFRVHHRVAERFRDGPVLLAGDAAHVHSPAGGQGMNLGLRDAVALGEALADVLDGGPDRLLDRYAEQRRPVAEEVVGLAARMTRIATVPPAARPLRNALLRTVFAVPAARRGLALRLSGLAQRPGGEATPAA